MIDAAEEIAQTFARLSGCVDETDWAALRVKDGYVRKQGKVLSLEERRERQKARNRAWSKARTREARDKHNRARRVTRLRKHLEAWATEGHLICLGRELPSERWGEIFRSPVGSTEIDAVDDFIFFLKVCRRVRVDQIASLLKTTQEEVRTALKRRGVQ